MAIGALTPQQVGSPVRQVNKFKKYPAPIKGIDTRVSVSLGDPLHCIYTFNLVPFDYGMRVRQGYREFVLNLDLGASVGVHTIVPFEGVLESGADDRLFAVTNEGIWDVTTFDAAPTIKTTFLDQSTEAGYGVYTHYVDGSGADLLYYADSRNGLFVYDPVADTWVPETGITGPVSTNINFIVAHKQRLWLCEENSQTAWYLEVGSNSGEATEFVFASKFKHGGALVGLYNWSVDGGDGIDDFLVAVSRAGDVLPFQGEDPSSASTWSIVGTYYIGKVPIGPNFATEHGGELYLLSSYGVVGMNDLLKGVNTVSAIVDPEGDSASAKISGLLRERVVRTINVPGWTIRVVPSDGSMVINEPKVAGRAQLQFAYNISTTAWGLWRDVPMSCFDSFQGFLAFGDLDSRILFMDTNTDNIQITPPVGRPNGDGIRFSVLTGFHGIDAEASYKQVKLIRPDFIAKSEPSFKCQARYDYDLSEITPGSASVEVGAEVGAEWDAGDWDVALWGSDNFEGFTGIQGTWGTGRYVAIAMAGESRADTRFVGWDLTYTIGGFFR